MMALKMWKRFKADGNSSGVTQILKWHGANGS